MCHLLSYSFYTHNLPILTSLLQRNIVTSISHRRSQSLRVKAVCLGSCQVGVQILCECVNVTSMFFPIYYPSGSDGKMSCLQWERPGFDPRVGKILWRRKWQPTPVLLPGNLMDRGAWWATVHWVAKSWTWLSNFTFTFTYELDLEPLSYAVQI